MSGFSDYRTIAKRFGAVGVEQNVYKECYTTLADFLIGLKNVELDYQYFPNREYVNEAKEYESRISKVLSDYASTMDYQLNNLPKNMAVALERTMGLIGPAIEAAGRMAKDGTNIEDRQKIIIFLSDAGAFAENYAELCSILVDNLKKFKSEGLVELDEDMKKLIETVSGSSSTYKGLKKELQKQIDILKETVKDCTNGAIGAGVGTGLFLVLGAVAVIATIATAGATAPALVVLAAAGVPCLIGAAATGFLTYEAVAAQNQIKALTAAMSDCDVAIAQLDLYGQMYDGMIGQIDSVADAVETMGREWKMLADELEGLSKLVKDADDCTAGLKWAELEELLNSIDAAMRGLETEINKVRIDETVVSKGSFSFEMTEEEMQKECAEAEQVSLRRYLLSA